MPGSSVALFCDGDLKSFIVLKKKTTNKLGKYIEIQCLMACFRVLPSALCCLWLVPGVTGGRVARPSPSPSLLCASLAALLTAPCPRASSRAPRGSLGIGLSRGLMLIRNWKFPSSFCHRLLVMPAMRCLSPNFQRTMEILISLHLALFPPTNVVFRELGTFTD